MATRKKTTKEPAVIEFPENFKNKLLGIIQQAALSQQNYERQLIQTVDIFLDAKEIEDKSTWAFDKQNLRLVKQSEQIEE